MPTPRALTPEEAQWYQSQGIDPSNIVATDPDSQPMSTLSAIGKTAEAHAGGYVGGGLGALTGMEGGAALGALGGPAAPVTIPLGAIVGGALAGMGGGYLGQKAQNALVGEDETKQLEQGAQEASQAHPYISAATDIGASALLSGGEPNLSNIPAALRGETPAIAKLALNSIVNPAINTGLNYAVTGQAPTTRDLVTQGLGGLFFSEQNALGRAFGSHGLPQEEKGEPLAKIQGSEEPTKEEATRILSPFLETNPESENYISDKNIRDAFEKIINPRPSVKDLNVPEQYIAKTQYDRLKATPVDQMRQMLHEKLLGEEAARSESSNPNMPWVDTRLAAERGEPTASIKQNELNENASKIPALPQEAQTVNEKAAKVAENITPQRAVNLQSSLDEEGIQKQDDPEMLRLAEEAEQQKQIDFQKARAEQVSQQYSNTNPERPISENQARIINPSTLLQNDLNRPESFDKNLYSPEKVGSNPEDEAQKIILQKHLAGDNKLSDAEQFANLKDKFQQLTKAGDFQNPLFKSIWNEMEAIRDRHGGFSPKVEPQTLEQHIKSGNANTGSVLQKIADKENEWSPLAKAMLEHASPEKLQDQVLAHNDNKSSSYYDPTHNISMIHNQHLTDNGVIIHELAHSLIHHNLPAAFSKLSGPALDAAMDRYLTNYKADKNVKELINVFKEARDKLGIKSIPSKEAIQYGNKTYALSNLTEFTSMALSDPEFQKALNEAQSSTKKSVFSRFFEAVRKLLGVPVKEGSLLERALKVNQKLIESKRPNYELDEEGNKLYSPADKYNKILKEMTDKRLVAEEEKRIAHLNFDDIRDKYLKKQATDAEWDEAHLKVKQAGEKVDKLQNKISQLDKSDDKFYRNELGKGYDIKLNSPKEVREESKELPTYRMGKIGEVFRSGIDTIKSLAHPDAIPTAKALQRVFQEKEQFAGRMINPVIEASRGLTKEGEARLDAAKRFELENKAPAPRSMFKTPAEVKTWNTYKSALKFDFDSRLKAEEPVIHNGIPRLPISDPNYHPTTSNPKVSNILEANTDPVAIRKLNREWNDYYTTKLGKTPEQAQKAFDEYKRALQGSAMNSNRAGNQTFFNAHRAAQGLPLPPAFERPGFLRNFEAYSHAAASDFSYYKHVESNPRVMSALGYTTDPWGRPVPHNPNQPLSGNTAVKNVLNEIKGESAIGQQGQFIAKSESLATATLLGPLTEFHKLASNFAKQISNYADNPIQSARAVIHGAFHIAEGWTHAKENGKIIMTAKSAVDMFNSQLTAADRLAGVARGVRQIYTLNDLTDKLNLGFLQASGEYLIPYKIHAAQEGDPTAIRLMQHLDTDWSKTKTYSPKDISLLSSQLAGVVHGTRDARTLPSWMLHDNEISAFFKLSNWGIAQTNSFMRDVYTPAREGNLKPLLMSAFGAAVGGYLIKELRQDIAGKKSQIPSLAEIAASDRGLKGNVPALAYNMMAAASYAGFGGMLSTIGRYPFDMAFKNTPQGATFPLDTVVSDLATTVSQVGQTISNDPNINWLELATHVGAHLMGTSFQLGRVALNQAIDTGLVTGSVAEKKELADKLGQLRRFYEVEGLPYNEMDAATSNPYMNLEQKRFKQTQDVGQAMQMLPELVGNIFQKYGSTPDVMMQKLKELKENEYSTFPDMKTLPLSFMKYMGYLSKTEGTEAAQAELMDFMRHKAINEAKASVVP